jgi:ADP-heptose:LPS heptosyltransferase
MFNLAMSKMVFFSYRINRPMKPLHMRHIDHYLGQTLCLASTILCKLISRMTNKSKESVPLRRIIFIKFIEQGATVLAYDAITRAIELVGRENVFLAVFKENDEIVSQLEVIPQQNIVAIKTDNILLLPFRIVGAIMRCHRLKVDTAVDLELFSRFSALFSFATGAVRRSGYHQFAGRGLYRGDLMTHKVQYNPYLHTEKAYRVLLESAFLDPKDLPLAKVDTRQWQSRRPVFKPTPLEVQELKDMILQKAADNQWFEHTLVLVHANIADVLPIRRWPPEHYSSLVHKMLKSYPNIRVIFVGAIAEKEPARIMANSFDSPRVLSIAGLTTLRETLTLFYCADLLVTSDSGPAHFASMTDIRIAALFGPETPDLFGPTSLTTTNISLRLACSPCITAQNQRRSLCQDNQCMKKMSVETVFEKVASLLDNIPSTPTERKEDHAV